MERTLNSLANLFGFAALALFCFMAGFTISYKNSVTQHLLTFLYNSYDAALGLIAVNLQLLGQKVSQLTLVRVEDIEKYDHMTLQAAGTVIVILASCVMLFTIFKSIKNTLK